MSKTTITLDAITRLLDSPAVVKIVNDAYYPDHYYVTADNRTLTRMDGVDGVWVVDGVLHTEGDVYTEYTSPTPYRLYLTTDPESLRDHEELVGDYMVLHLYKSPRSKYVTIRPETSYTSLREHGEWVSYPHDSRPYWMPAYRIYRGARMLA